jgi:hypothetical protein
MEGKGQPPPASWPLHPTPQLPGARRGERSAAAATALPPPPSKPASRQHAPPPAIILYEIFSTCVAKGIAAKLVYKTVGGKVETSLYCSKATPAAASVTPKNSRKRPDNERRRMRREAWRKRFSTGAGSAAAAPAAAAAPSSAAAPAAAAPAAAAPVAAAPAAAVTSAQIVRPAAPGAATAAPATAAVTPQRAWAWEPRGRLLVVARRLQEEHLESPETARGPECVSDFHISLSSSEDREPVEVCSRTDNSPTCLAAAVRVVTALAAANLGLQTSGEAALAVEERTEVKERTVEVEPVSSHHLHPHPGLSIFLVIPDVFCALCAVLETEKSGMLNAQIAIGLKEKNSRSSEKEIQRS